MKRFETYQSGGVDHEGVLGGEGGGLLSSLGGFVIRIHIMMYPACILLVSYRIHVS